VETAIGVFASRDHAEAAVKDLLRHGVPEPAIVFLTRAEGDATTTSSGQEVAAVPGVGRELAAGITSSASMVVPGVGRVFGLGARAAGLLGLLGGGSGGTVGPRVSRGPAQPTPEEKCPDDVVFFREVLKQGRSLIVVRTDSPEVAKIASRELDCLGLGLRPLSPDKMKAATRQVGNIVVVDISGRITLGEGNVRLREIVLDLLGKGNKQILLNLGEVHYVDSSGMGELVRLCSAIRGQGGEVRLVNPSARVQGLLQMTRLNAVFQIEHNEAAGIASFSGASPGVV
jgi:anti-sigma B factor antagonist